MRRTALALVVVSVLTACGSDSPDPVPCPFFGDQQHTITVVSMDNSCGAEPTVMTGDVFDPFDDTCTVDGRQHICDVQLTQTCGTATPWMVAVDFNEETQSFDGTIAITHAIGDGTCTETYDVVLTPLE